MEMYMNKQPCFRSTIVETKGAPKNWSISTSYSAYFMELNSL